MNKKCNTFSFYMKDYEEYNEYPCKEEINESSMWEDIATFIRIAMKNGYCLKVHFDGLTVIIEYNYDDPGNGDNIDKIIDELGLDLRWYQKFLLKQIFKRTRRHKKTR